MRLIYPVQGSKTVIGTLRSNEGDDNGNATKAIGLIKKKNNFARARFFVHFFASLHDYDVKMP